jgi:hypothetical protein
MNTVKIITKIENNQWVIEFSIEPGADFPSEIFIWENLGDKLGDYQAVCTLSDYTRYKTYNPLVPVPVFGNRFLKHTKGIIYSNIETDPQTIKDKILNDIKIFKASYVAGESSTEFINI